MDSIDAVREHVTAAAREHLGDQLGGRWSSMLSEGTRLLATDTGPRTRFKMRRRAHSDPVGRLGGPAPLPAGTQWPTWDELGLMAHIATLDCHQLSSRLPQTMQSAGFPSDGLLSFFYFDGQVDGGVELVGALFGTGDGARVIYTPPGVPAVPTEPPAPVAAYRDVELRAERVLTWPTWEHPDLYDGGKPAEGWDVLFETLDAVRQGTPGPLHQVGGNPDPVQGP
jgi:hypothetical protein